MGGGGWLSERPFTERTGDFGTKNNKEMYIFVKGSFCSGPGRNRRSLGTAQAENGAGGGGAGAFGRHIPVLS